MAHFDVPSLPDGYRLELVPSERPAALERDIMAFWQRRGAFPDPAQAERRLRRVLWIARDGYGDLAAVSSVVPRKIARLGFALHWFRCFVSPAHRRRGLARALLTATAAHLGERFTTGSGGPVRGLVVEVEDASLHQAQPDAVWHPVPFVYIGRSRRGAPLRVYYYPGARIT